MTVAEVTRLIDGGPYLADEAHAAGLVDRLSYWPDVLEQARSRVGAAAEAVSMGDYARAVEARPIAARR